MAYIHGPTGRPGSSAGAVFGLVVYAVNFYGFTGAFPWFAMARNWITVLAHAIFGLTLAWWLMRGRQPMPVNAV